MKLRIRKVLCSITALLLCFGMIHINALAGEVAAQVQEAAQTGVVGTEEAIVTPAQDANRQAPSIDFAGNGYFADGDWTYTKTVTLAAESASKMYDGTPLRRDKAAVYGLPAAFSIWIRIEGSQLDAGSSENHVAGYTIFNQQGEDVTGHFTNVETVPGQLVVDPVPLTVRTGSASKVYDGTPLTNKEAELICWFTSQSIENSRNIAYTFGSQDADDPTQALYGIVGEIMIHGTNPLTGETMEIVLQAGQKLTVRSEGTDDDNSILIEIILLTEEEIPKEILQLYADDPELLEQACQETGWDKQKIEARIDELLKPENASAAKDEAADPQESAGTLFANNITMLIGRSSGAAEVSFASVTIDPSITVKATGSRTEVGDSVNTYEITWGKATPSNYTLSEELGTLTVTPVVRPSAPNPTPAPTPEPTPTPTPTPTPVPTPEPTPEPTPTPIPTPTPDPEPVPVPDPDPTKVTIVTGSAEKVYDGAPLTCDQVATTGFPEGKEPVITTTGSITDVGETENTYVIDWGSLDPADYTITENLGRLAVTGLPVTFDLGCYSGYYSGNQYFPEDITGTYEDGSMVERQEQEVLYNDAGIAEGITATFNLTGGSVVQLTCGGVTDPDSYSITPTVTFLSGNEDNYVLSYTNNVITVEPMPLTLTLNGTDPIVYDGKFHGGSLTASDGTVEPVSGTEWKVTQANGDVISVTITGGGTDAGTYSLDGSYSFVSGSEANYAVTMDGETLTIAQAPLTVITDSAEKISDGDPLTQKDGASLEGLVNGETATLNVTGSQTEIGSSTNTYEIEWGSAKEDNYFVEPENLGSLTVLPEGPFAIVVDACGYTIENIEDDHYPRDISLTIDGTLYPADSINISGDTLTAVYNLFGKVTLTVVIQSGAENNGEIPLNCSYTTSGDTSLIGSVAFENTSIIVAESPWAGGHFYLNPNTNLLTYTNSEGQISEYKILDYNNAEKMINSLYAQGVSPDEILQRLNAAGYIDL